MALGLVVIGLFLYFIGTWKQKPKEITDKISEYICVCVKLYLCSVSLWRIKEISFILGIFNIIRSIVTCTENSFAEILKNILSRLFFRLLQHFNTEASDCNTPR